MGKMGEMIFWIVVLPDLSDTQNDALHDADLVDIVEPVPDNFLAFLQPQEGAVAHDVYANGYGDGRDGFIPRLSAAGISLLTNIYYWIPNNEMDGMVPKGKKDIRILNSVFFGRPIAETWPRIHVKAPRKNKNFFDVSYLYN